MPGTPDAAGFDALVEAAEAADTDGWGFSYLDGRASEERPPWAYRRLLAEHLAGAGVALDLETGGGEVTAAALSGGVRLVATEAYLPNARIAHRRLGATGASVVVADAALPFPDAAFDVVSARHPVATPYADIARVLRPGGRFCSQQVGAGSNRELYEFLMGPQPANPTRHPATHRRAAEAAGLLVERLEEATLEVRFADVGAVVWFLRKVPWTVPGFTVAAYRDRLAALDEQIRARGAFVCHATRFLLVAAKPG